MTQVIQQVNLNLIPQIFGANSVLVPCSQYDKSYRVIQFNVYNGRELYSIPSTCTVIIRGTKKDNTGFEYNCEFSGSQVIFPLEPQITVLSGKVPAELRIVNGEELIGSANFLFMVEPSPLTDDTIISETQLPLLEEALQAAAEAEQSRILAEAAKDSAEDYAMSAGESSQSASQSAVNASISEANASQSASNALTSEQNAKESEDLAQGYSQDAQGYASSASDSADSASQSATSASQSAQHAEEVVEDIEAYVTEAQGYAEQSHTYSQNASVSASNALTSENNAHTSELNAKASEDNAKQSETNASTSASNASQSATNSANSATQSANSATIATTNALKSEGYAVGEQNGEPVDETSIYYHNNAKWYSEHGGGGDASWGSITGNISNQTDLIEKFDEVESSIPTKTSDLTNDSGFISSIPSEYVTDSELNTALSTKANTSSLSTVATSGSYNDLLNKPTIPTKTSELTNNSNFVSDANYVHTDNNFTTAEKTKLNGISSGAEVNVQSDWNVTNTSSDAYIKNKPTIPTKTSDLTNDSGFITSVPVSSVNGRTGAVTGLQETSNLVTSVSSSSTNTQYPSAKCLYDLVGDIETLLASI